MSKENHTIKKGSRRIAIVMASIMALTLVLSATFAWYQTQNAQNVFTNESGDKGVVLHDDFDGGPEKQVYVENTSENSDIFVRIMLREFMDLTSYLDRPLYSSDYTTHVPGISVENCGFSNKFLEKFHDHFKWHMGGQTEYLSSPVLANGKHNGFTEDLGVTKDKMTLDATVISMADYKAMSATDKESFIGWVYDTDGWAYWSQPLVAQTATGMLLNAVTADPSIDAEDYYYVISVIMEAVDFMDLPMWTVASGNNDGRGQNSVLGTGETAQLASPDAINMLNGISKPSSSVTSIAVTTNPTKMTYVPGDTVDLTGIVVTVTFTDGTTEEITSGFDYSPKSALKSTDTEITISYGGATTTLSITIDSLSGLGDVAVNGTYVVDGVSWTVVKKENSSGKDYVLLVTTQSAGITTYQTLGNQPGIYEGSNLQTVMTAYYNNSIKNGSLAEYVVVPEFVEYKYPTDRQSRPTEVLASGSENEIDVVFALYWGDLDTATKTNPAFSTATNIESWMACYSEPSLNNAQIWSGEGFANITKPVTAPNIGYRPALWVVLP
ncbi:MAG: bacterial Ig-like domain-containing protein [Coriobacteriales bacterium]|jgi:hypothetical protein|nr:bacterial Ig-like domain-containing protein [Coriobacteriales bacterium]